MYNNETTYLEETNVPGGGNVVKGFDGFVKNSNNLISSTSSGRQSTGFRKYEVTDNQRIFSNSSDSAKDLNLVYKDV